jgi:hypothetical protein
MAAFAGFGCEKRAGAEAPAFRELRNGGMMIFEYCITWLTP